VLTLEGDAIAAITWFADTGALRRFGLPRTLPNPRALADVASLLTPGSSQHHHKIAGPWRCERAPGNLPGSGDPAVETRTGQVGVRRCSRSRAGASLVSIETVAWDDDEREPN
jgi:hypothetical protein